MRASSIWRTRLACFSSVPRTTSREFADNFLSKLSSADQVAIIQYADRVYTVQDWTHDARAAFRSKRFSAAGIETSYSLIRGAVHPIAVRRRGGRPLALPRARTWARLVEGELRRFQAEEDA